MILRGDRAKAPSKLSDCPDKGEEIERQTETGRHRKRQRVSETGRNRETKKETES